MSTKPGAGQLHLADRAAEEEKERIRAEEAEKALALAENARQTTRSEVAIERQGTDERRARYFAAAVRKLSIVPAIILFVIFAALYDKSALFNGQSYLVASLQILFLIPLVASTLDLFGIGIVKDAFATLEKAVFRRTFKILNGEEWRAKK